jgi:hypothetical protein
MQINCLGCGFKIDLDEAYDDYQGTIKCFACGADTEIATQEGSIRTARLVTETMVLSLVGSE